MSVLVPHSLSRDTGIDHDNKLCAHKTTHDTDTHVHELDEREKHKTENESKNTAQDMEEKTEM